jgi:dTDP-4-dehydrorhamnose reductase
VSLALLVFGRTGQVGRELRRLAGPGLRVTALDRAAADRADPRSCAAAGAGAAPDVVINAAAHTAVDRAETEEAAARVVNAEAPGAMARACAARGLPFLHLSTDYVFDGSGDRPWREDDPIAPLNAYGRGKAEGERRVAEARGTHAIIRTSWVFSAHGGNFVTSMLRRGAVRDRLTVVDDQRGGPTAAADIAAALVTMARAFAEGRGTSGVFHFCGGPTVSWRDFAVEIFRQAAWSRAPDIAAIRTEDWSTPARRPRNSALDCRKIAAAYGIGQPDWRRSLAPVIAELKDAAA